MAVVGDAVDAFSQLGLHRMDAACFPNSLASMELLERTDFSAEGEFSANLRINGQWRDYLHYAFLREDFEEIRGRVRRYKPSTGR